MVSSLQTRILRFTIGILGAMALTFALAVWNATTNHSHRQIDSQISVAESVLKQLLANREEQLHSSAEVLTSDFGFKQAVATGDAATMESVLRNHGERIGADLMVLMSLQGELLASDQDAIETRFNQDFFIRSSLGGQGTTDYLTLNDRLYQVILLPVKAPLPIAIAMVGFELNQSLASEWKGLTGVDISFVNRDAQPMEVIASTLPESQWSDALETIQPSQHLGNLPIFGRPDYASVAFNLSHANTTNNRIVLTYSVESAFADFDLLHKRIIFITLAGAILALIGGVVMAKNLAAPIRSLAESASRIASGEFDRLVAAKRNTQEISELANAFETMQQDLSDREARIIHQAHHDPLTNLINRQHVITCLHDYLDSADYKPIVIICINILDFRIVNDTFGHVVGDQCLQQIGLRFNQLPESGTICARLGGDEFLLAIPLESSIERTAENLLAVLSRPYLIQQLEISLRFSMGVAAAPRDGTDANQLVQHASIALDMARRESLGLAFYSPSMEETHLKRLKLLSDLKATLAANDGQLRMYFQPKVQARDLDQYRFEALIRWIHPEQGFIPPDLFIPLAEQAGLIADITDWVVGAVIEHIADWKRHQFSAQVAINLSAKDLSRKHLLERVRDLLDSHQLSPQCLAFEITESEIMRDAASAIDLLVRFRSAGFDLAIDDFGTGYSSLSQLKHMPVTELKIDKSFVLQLDQLTDDQIIVKSTIDLAHSFNLKVVAEGIENEASMALLRNWGCDWLQGYHLSKPLPAADVLPWVERFTGKDQAHTTSGDA